MVYHTQLICSANLNGGLITDKPDDFSLNFNDTVWITIKQICRIGAIKAMYANSYGNSYKSKNIVAKMDYNKVPVVVHMIQRIIVSRISNRCCFDNLEGCKTVG